MYFLESAPKPSFTGNRIPTSKPRLWQLVSVPLAGRRALVTAGSRGIGRAIAADLREVYDSVRERFDAACAELEAEYQDQLAYFRPGFPAMDKILSKVILRVSI